MTAAEGWRLVERSWIGPGAVPPVPNSDEQAFVAHRGEIAAGYANLGEILRADHALAPDERDGAISQ